jgi:hypothetical protein
MTTDESIKKEWEKVLQQSNLPLTVNEISKDKLNQYFSQSDPFNAEQNFNHVKAANLNNDNTITKEEYDNYSRYMHDRMGEKGRMARCIVTFAKWTSTK